MIFSTYRFILIFLPVTLLVFRLLIKTGRVLPAKFWLIIASLLFYAQGSPRFLPALLFTAAFNFTVGRLLVADGVSRRAKGVVFGFGLLENIGLLGFFKYSGFIIENINFVAGTDIGIPETTLPLGISFFTFNIISYITDAFRGKAKPYSPLDYLAFVTFFPYLIMGPIVRHSDIIRQMGDSETFRFRPDNFCLALFLFSVGCAKKVVLADPLIAFASAYYMDPLTGGFLESWTATLSYTLAYYFDFSAYGDMAVGLGLFFGIRLPINFNSPYKARNFVDFWRRWNISLTGFLNEYVFGSVYRFGERAGKLFVGVMATFLVSGVWHGAGWNFIAWGVVNGFFVYFGMLLTLHNIRLPKAVAHILTLVGILFTRVLFDSRSLAGAAVTLRSMADVSAFGGLIAFGKANILTLSLILAGAVIVFCTENAGEHMKKFQPDLRHALWTGALLTVSLFFMTNVSSFLYFQF
jgi:D-alanyl-lipoteichoic acid acyltransferase DltB (MBOAT superfamily)